MGFLSNKDKYTVVVFDVYQNVLALQKAQRTPIKSKSKSPHVLGSPASAGLEKMPGAEGRPKPSVIE